MNNQPDINDLFEASRRREADQRRQQQLSDMIDRLAESGERKAESGNRRARSGKRRAESGERIAESRSVWMYASIAASVLLLVGVGLHILIFAGEPPAYQPIVAETKPPVSVVVDSTTYMPNTEASGKSDSEKESIIQSAIHDRQEVLAHNEKPAEEPKIDSQQNEADAAKIPIETPDVIPAAPLLAEEIATPSNSNVCTEAGSEKKTVFERTSTHLVCGSGCKPERRQTPVSDAPQLAFFNNSGTGTEFGVGSITF